MSILSRSQTARDLNSQNTRTTCSCCPQDRSTTKSRRLGMWQALGVATHHLASYHTSTSLGLMQVRSTVSVTVKATQCIWLSYILSACRTERLRDNHPTRMSHIPDITTQNVSVSIGFFLVNQFVDNRKEIDLRCDVLLFHGWKNISGNKLCTDQSQGFACKQGYIVLRCIDGGWRTERHPGIHPNWTWHISVFVPSNQRVCNTQLHGFC